MSGRRPDIKLSVKLKDGGERIYPGAGWKSDNGMGINFRLDDGWKLVGPDGREYTAGKEGNAYFDVYDNREDNAPRQPQRRPAGYFGGEDFSDAANDADIPF